MKGLLKKYTVSFFITVIALVSVLVIEPVKIEAASCTSHQYISVLASTQLERTKTTEFFDGNSWVKCTEATYLYAYIYKCKNCGAYAGGGYTKEVVVHSRPDCPLA